MKTIITEEMRFRLRAVEYAIKCNNDAESARRILGFKTPNEMVEEYFKNLA